MPMPDINAIIIKQETVLVILASLGVSFAVSGTPLTLATQFDVAQLNPFGQQLPPSEAAHEYQPEAQKLLAVFPAGATTVGLPLITVVLAVEGQLVVLQSRPT